MNCSHQERVTKNAQAITRIANLGFSAPPQLNVATSLFYTDIDNETGQKSRIAVAEDVGVQTDVFRALLNMVLLGLANELNVDRDKVPRWVPQIDEALDSHLRITSGELYQRLVDEIAEDDELSISLEEQTIIAVTPSSERPLEAVHLFSEIGLALEECGRRGGIRGAFIDPGDDVLDDLIHQITQRVVSSITKLGRLFGLEAPNLATLKIESGYLSEDDDCDLACDIDDLIIATALAWITNLTTSTGEPSGERIGLWLCDENNERFSRALGLDIKRDGGAIRFNLPVSPTIGRAELQQLKGAVETLVQLGGPRTFQPPQEWYVSQQASQLASFSHR